MSKANENAARSSATNLMQQAPTQLGPIASQAGANNADTFGASSTAFKGLAAGGFTPGQEGAYLNRATEASDSASDALQNQAKLSAAKTGQGNPQAAISRIARQLGQNKSQSLNDAQVSLNQQENANKATGAQGLSGLAGQSAQQQMAALGLQFNTEAEAQQALNNLSHNAGPLNNILAIASTAMGKPGSGATAG